MGAKKTWYFSWVLKDKQFPEGVYGREHGKVFWTEELTVQKHGGFFRICYSQELCLKTNQESKSERNTNFGQCL